MKWALGCALWVGMSSFSQAALIDSVRVGQEAFLLSDSHFYRYSSVTRQAASTSLAGQPVAMAVADDGIFIAYENGRLEKRDFDGNPVPDPSGGNVERNLQNITDVAFYDEKVYVAFFEGDELHELNAADLSPTGGEGFPSYSLAKPMRKLVPYESAGGDLVFYSPDGVNLNILNWPAELVDDEVPVEQMDIAQGHGSYLDTPNNLFIVDNDDNAFIVMDNGSYWTLEGLYLSWIAGQEFHFLDQAEDGQWSVVRDKVVACESGAELDWTTDLIHYNTGVAFDSRSKVGSQGAVYEVVHLWGADPQAHLFREAGLGNLVVDQVMRSQGLPFDDGKQPFSVAANSPLSEFQLLVGVDDQQIALDDDHEKAYVLHQGNNRCDAMVRVYNLESKAWVSTIPLRWRPKAIAMVGGDNPDSSDDMLAVVYEQSFDTYGRSQMLVGYVDVNAASPVENPSRDFAGYGVFYSDLSTVQASRYAVLFQMERATEGSVITAWGPNGESAFYQDCEQGDSCPAPRDIDFWQSRSAPGEQSVLVLKAGDDVRLLNINEALNSVTFDAPAWTMTLADNFEDVEAPLVFSPQDQEFLAMNLNEGAIGFQRGTPAFSEGKPEDFLPEPLFVSTWSDSLQGEEENYVLYNVSGGSADSDEPARIQRWSMVLGEDGHFEFDNEDQADVAGVPVMVRVTDSEADDLLVATLYQKQIRFTPFDRNLGTDPDDGGGDSGGDGGDEPGDNSGSGNGGGSNSNGFGSSGGGSVFWLFGLMILVGGLRRRG